MPATLNNVATSNEYTGANTLECPRAIRFELTVSNASIYYQVGLNVAVHKQDPNTIMALLGGDVKPTFVNNIIYGPEVFFLPRNSILSRVCDSIRIRSATPGKPAQVTVTAWKGGEIIGFRA